MYFEAEKFLTNGEMLAITKILIATRTLPQDKMNQLVEKLEGFASTKDKKRLKELVKRELYHYIPVATLCNDLIDNLYALAEAIDDKQEITITYYKMDKSRIDRRIRPLAIVFSEYYFYLIAVHEVDDEWKERYYRIDRITDMIKPVSYTHLAVKVQISDMAKEYTGSLHRIKTELMEKAEKDRKVTEKLNKEYKQSVSNQFTEQSKQIKEVRNVFENKIESLFSKIEGIQDVYKRQPV